MSAASRIPAVLATALALVALAGGADAQNGRGTPPDLERRVKAACLYKFAGYVEWPAAAFSAPEAPVRIAVLGDDVLAAELERLVTGRTSGGRPVSVERLADGELPAGIHVLFVARPRADRLRELARTARERAVLVVSESRGALGQGGMINFVLSGGRVRFEVNLRAVEAAGLAVSSRMLAVAQAVITGGH